MTLKLYDELAEWWPLLSHPDDYEEEAGVFIDAIKTHARRDVQDVLELGSGGGNNASYMKSHFRMTLVDLSPAMLDVSRKLNPECEHLRGDMRDLRLGRLFDAVFVHDAVMYMSTEDDLRRAIGTAAEHVAPGGLALFVPDETAENFRPGTDHGGHDGDGRAMRYLEWHTPASGTAAQTLMVYVMRDGEDITVEHEVWAYGLFPRDTWLRLIAGAGLEPLALPYPLSDFEVPHEIFAGLKPD
ncbi:MAG: class I SAM-dependent methyltransferase [Actinomycetota bacterium]